MSTPGRADAPRFLVCEDGDEYTERFTRLLGGSFRFVRVTDHAQTLAAAGAGFAGLLLDLDFRRSAADVLVDEAGAARPALTDGERRRLAAIQGILILRALRAAGVALPALLFADVDQAQLRYLESSLAPLQVVSSATGIAAVAEKLAAMAAR